MALETDKTDKPVITLSYRDRSAENKQPKGLSIEARAVLAASPVVILTLYNVVRFVLLDR